VHRPLGRELGDAGRDFARALEQVAGLWGAQQHARELAFAGQRTRWFCEIDPEHAGAGAQQQPRGRELCACSEQHEALAAQIELAAALGNVLHDPAERAARSLRDLVRLEQPLGEIEHLAGAQKFAVEGDLDRQPGHCAQARAHQRRGRCRRAQVLQQRNASGIACEAQCFLGAAYDEARDVHALRGRRAGSLQARQRAAVVALEGARVRRKLRSTERG
jgi:hypothetical protein